MSWTDTFKATALTALARRTSTANRVGTDAPWTWNVHDAWLTRVKQPRDLAARSSPTDPADTSRLDVAEPG